MTKQKSDRRAKVWLRAFLKLCDEFPELDRDAAVQTVTDEQHRRFKELLAWSSSLKF